MKTPILVFLLSVACSYSQQEKKIPIAEYFNPKSAMEQGIVKVFKINDGNSTVYVYDLMKCENDTLTVSRYNQKKEPIRVSKFNFINDLPVGFEKQLIDPSTRQSIAIFAKEKSHYPTRTNETSMYSFVGSSPFGDTVSDIGSITLLQQTKGDSITFEFRSTFTVKIQEEKQETVSKSTLTHVKGKGWVRGVFEANNKTVIYDLVDILSVDEIDLD